MTVFRSGSASAPSATNDPRRNQRAPGPSQLYHLKPMGMSSQLVESQVSYIASLAAEHCVSPIQLIVDEIAPHLGKRYTNSMRASDEFFSDWRHALALCGSGPIAQEWTRTLEDLTGWQHLALLTLAPLNLVVSAPTQTTLRKERAWCPTCYIQWRDERTAPYTPLLWMMAQATYCPIHHMPLAIYCPNPACGRTATWLVAQRHQERCPHCQTWLGETFSPEMSYLIPTRVRRRRILTEKRTPSNPQRQLHDSANIGQLLAHLNSMTPLNPTPVITQALARWKNAMSRQQLKRLQRGAGITTRMIDDWSEGAGRPSLAQVLSFCWIIGASVTDLLDCDGLIPLARLEKMKSHHERTPSA